MASKYKILAYAIVIIISIDMLILLTSKSESTHPWKHDKPTSSNTIINITNAPNSQEFDRIINKYCNVHNLTLDGTCLQMLRSYDRQTDLVKPKNEKDSCNECITYTNESTKQTEKLIIYYHTFWQISSWSKGNEYNFRVLKLNLMSYLSTQNLCCTRFILWKLNSFPESMEQKLRETFAHYISSGIVQIKTFYMEEFCNDVRSSFTRSELCRQPVTDSITSGNLIMLSDLVRFVVLDVYGGIYTDGDVIYLKNMRHLWTKNFAYRWSSQFYINTAVLGIDRRIDSQIDSFYDLLKNHLALQTYTQKFLVVLSAYIFRFNYVAYLFHPATITDLIASRSRKHRRDLNFRFLTAYHSLLFDSAWLCNDKVHRVANQQICRFGEFTTKRVISSSFDPNSDFFAGVFAYHLHLAKTSSKVHPDSYFRKIEKFYVSFLNLPADL